MSRSRVQMRISFLRECAGKAAGVEDSGTDVVKGWFWSVLCIIGLPSIYSMGIAGRARFELHGMAKNGAMGRINLAGQGDEWGGEKAKSSPEYMDAARELRVAWGRLVGAEREVEDG